MVDWVFVARVLPERMPISVGDQLKGKALNKNGKAAYTYEMFVHHSQVLIKFEIAEKKINIFTYRNIAAKLIANLTDLVGWLNGQHFDVEIISAYSETTGEKFVFGNEIPILFQNKFAPRELRSELINAVYREPTIQMVLEDFRQAMRVPVGTGFFCYRAIEAMMQTFKARPDEDEKISWPKFRTALRIDRPVLDSIKKHADFPRHGVPSSIEDEDRAHIFKTTDEIIHRYIHFVLGNRQPLPTDVFKDLKLETRT